jgi:deoxyribonuclease IV
MIFGAHESIAGGVYKAIERGKEATCDTIQIFNKNNNSWKAAELKPDDVEKYFKLIDELGVTVATSHTSYLINIASPDKILYEKSINSLAEEMDRCNTLRVPNLVLHPGSHVGTGEEGGIKRIGKAINKLFKKLKNNECTLLLETTAGQGSHLGYTFEQLAEMIDLVDDQDHIGVCMDTCHIFSAGYPLTDPKDYKKTMKSFNDTIGLDKLKIIHMNDSKKPFGEKKDRHEHIGKGEIGIEAFRNFVNDKRLTKVPMILETPKGDDLKDDIKNLKILRGLVKK